jgi:hypothetical protein
MLASSSNETPTRKICWDEDMLEARSPFHEEHLQEKLLRVVPWQPPPETLRYISSVEAYNGVIPPSFELQAPGDHLNVVPV